MRQDAAAITDVERQCSPSLGLCREPAQGPPGIFFTIVPTRSPQSVVGQVEPVGQKPQKPMYAGC